MASNTGVVPSQRWSEIDKSFYLNSSAGLIKYKPKTVKDTAHFRDEYVNAFVMIMQSGLGAEAYFDLYRNILKNVKGVRYTANLHTRIKGKLCTLKPW